MGYRSKKSHRYFLVAIQILIYAFSAVNYGEFIFEPFLERFSPHTLLTIQRLYQTSGSLIWEIRGILGLIISLFFGVFLVILVKTSSKNSEKSAESLVEFSFSTFRFMNKTKYLMTKFLGARGFTKKSLYILVFTGTLLTVISCHFFLSGWSIPL